MADDGPSKREEATPPASRPDAGNPPGLRAQVGATVAAVKRLIGAHVDLAKAEAGDIVGEVKRMVALAGLAIGVLVFAGILMTVGGLLFLGEWLFGSIGWGVLLGTVLLVDVAVMALLLALDVKGGRVTSSLLLAAVAGAVVGVILALNLTNRGWTAIGDALVGAYDPATRTVLLALGVSAVVVGILGFIAGVRGGLGSAIAGLIAGALVGLVLGGLTVIAIPANAGAAIGVLVALIAWPALAGRDLIRTGVDGEAIMKRFTPTETIELTKETIEWVRARTPLAPKS